jgi:hypothetical protein
MQTRFADMSLVEFSSLKYIWAFYIVFFLCKKHNIFEICYVSVIMFRGYEDIPTMLGP